MSLITDVTVLNNDPATSVINSTVHLAMPLEITTIASFTFADVAERDAETSMVDGSLGWVRNIDRSYRYDAVADRWYPLSDVDYINVLDFGAHWTLADNSTAFHAAIASSRGQYPTPTGTKYSLTILVPAAPDDSGLNSAGYNFTSALNLRGYAHLRFIASGANAPGQFAQRATVPLFRISAAGPVLDVDNEASSLQVLAGCYFEGFMFYNSAGPPVVTSGLCGWTFVHCVFSTFQNIPAFKTQNSFWVWFRECSFINALGCPTGVVYVSGKNGMSSDASNTYLMHFDTCRFSGGPFLEYHFWNNQGGSNPHDFTFTNCEGENQDGDEGMLLKVTKEASVTGHALTSLTYNSCKTYDPVNTTTLPYTMINICEQINLFNVELIMTSCANAGGSRIKQIAAPLSNIAGVRVRDNTQWIIVGESNQAHPAAYGFNWDMGFATVMAGGGTLGVAPAATDGDRLGSGPNPTGGIFLAHISERYARVALVPDALWFGPGSSGTLDVSLRRANIAGVGLKVGTDAGNPLPMFIGSGTRIGNTSTFVSFTANGSLSVRNGGANVTAIADAVGTFQLANADTNSPYHYFLSPSGASDTADTFRITGHASQNTGRILKVARNNGSEIFAVNGAGAIGFFGVTPVLRQTSAAAATDATTTQNLANSLRDIIINLGLAQA